MKPLTPYRLHKSNVKSAVILALLLPCAAAAGDTVRARDLGIPFTGNPGPYNAITDVRGVEVGHSTLIYGEGALSRGKGPVRTGVTVIHPRGKNSTEAVHAGWFTLNASGEMTGTTWLTERGLIDGPIAITNTHSVGVVRDASVAWMVDRGWAADWHAPVVAETYDGALNDIDGQHVSAKHVFDAFNVAAGGVISEGSVGGGTGMICNGFKGGIGSASRKFNVLDRPYTVGVLVQCNYNWEGEDLRLGGRLVSEALPVGQHCHADRGVKRSKDWFPYCDDAAGLVGERTRDGSIIVVIATDAPLMPHQLARLAKRPSLALGRLGAISNDGSGDIFVAFSTGNSIDESAYATAEVFPNNRLSLIFRETVHAVEEAIVNAMAAADTMLGADGLRVEGLPHSRVQELFQSTDN